MISIRKGHYLIHWWQGTDALKLVTYPPTSKIFWYLRIFLERILWKITEPLFREHWVVHERLADHLIKFGISPEKITVRPPSINISGLVKVRHSGYNVAYYYPGDRENKTFKRWLYGMDIIEEVKKAFPNVFWMELDGTMDMNDLYRVIDAYIRPTRHDGMSRMVMECQALQIPYYWDETFNPNAEEIIQWLELVLLSPSTNIGNM